ncbi:hypothetical protein ACHAWF_018053 [Thalassiosira exigua]
MGSCNSVLMKPCLGETDIRYDANFPKTIIEAVSVYHVIHVKMHKMNNHHPHHNSYYFSCRNLTGGDSWVSSV